MTRRILMFTAALGAWSVAQGAFGAHAVKSWLAPFDDAAQRLGWWETATDYLFFHLIFFVAAAVVADRLPSRLLRVSVGLAGGGLLVFSGTLTLMTLTGIRWLGAITPLGGTALIAAWVTLAVAAARTPRT